MSDTSTSEAVAALGEGKPAGSVAGKAEARWRGLIADQQASGLSVARFCRERGVPASSLFAWKRRLAGHQPRRRKPATPASFVEARMTAAGPAGGVTGPLPADRPGGIELRLRRGRRILRVRPGFDPGLLADLVRTLEAVP